MSGNPINCGKIFILDFEKIQVGLKQGKRERKVLNHYDHEQSIVA